jgi:hypothetical protein
MQKWRADVALHLDKTAQKRIEREKERERKERRKLCHGERTHRDTTHKSCSRSIGMAAKAKSGWRRRHVACDDRRGREVVRGRHD